MIPDIGPRQIERLRDIAVRAGREIMAVYESDFAVEAKDDASPVTEADRRAERLITAAIRSEVTDAFPIVGEEAVAEGVVPDVSGGAFWLLDPLDGTKEFVRRGRDFTVNIGLIEAGRPVFGIVHIPLDGETFWGGPAGAFTCVGSGETHPIRCRPCPTEGVVAIVSKSHRTPAVDEFLKDCNVLREISVGSSLKFCRVASGEADLYPRIGRTMEWDTAAGHAVLRFAGGSVTTLDGAELTYGKPGFENPHFVARGA